jgi:hypothetical protein
MASFLEEVGTSFPANLLVQPADRERRVAQFNAVVLNAVAWSAAEIEHLDWHTVTLDQFLTWPCAAAATYLRRALHTAEVAAGLVVDEAAQLAEAARRAHGSAGGSVYERLTACRLSPKQWKLMHAVMDRGEVDEADVLTAVYGKNAHDARAKGNLRELERATNEKLEAGGLTRITRPRSGKLLWRSP